MGPHCFPVLFIEAISLADWATTTSSSLLPGVVPQGRGLSSGWGPGPAEKRFNHLPFLRVHRDVCANRNLPRFLIPCHRWPSVLLLLLLLQVDWGSIRDRVESGDSRKSQWCVENRPWPTLTSHSAIGITIPSLSAIAKINSKHAAICALLPLCLLLQFI